MKTYGVIIVHKRFLSPCAGFASNYTEWDIEGNIVKATEYILNNIPEIKPEYIISINIVEK